MKGERCYVRSVTSVGQEKNRVPDGNLTRDRKHKGLVQFIV